MRSGGGFSQNPNSEPLGVKGSSSNFANTDVSGATTLAPAPDAAEREARAAWQETSDELKGPGGEKYPEGAGGQGSFPGSHNADGYSGGPTWAKQELLDQSRGSAVRDARDNSTTNDASRNPGETSDTNVGDGYGETSDAGGNYNRSEDTASGSTGTASENIASVYSETTPAGKPKGKNITEGGFDDDPSKNASYTSEIGSENDPGRVAENAFQRQTGAVAGGGGPRQKDITGQGQYDVLETDQSL